MNLHPVRAAVLVASVAAVAAAAGLVPFPAAVRPEPQMRWWKGNLHTHTLWSDGQAFPETVVSWYKRHGYHFLALSDHNVLQEGERWVTVPGGSWLEWALTVYRDEFGHAWVETRRKDGKLQVRLKTLAELRTRFEEPDRFLLIPGEEITDRCETKPVHLNATNLKELIHPQGGTSVAETIRANVRAVREQAQRLRRPILVHLNHPNYGWAVRTEDLVAVKEERYFEVFNGHPGVRNEGDAEHISVERMWDEALIGRLLVDRTAVLYGLATDDAHWYRDETAGRPIPGRGWIMVRAAYLTPWAIIRAIEKGDFYASTGVTLANVCGSSEALTVEVEPDPGATYVIEFIGALRPEDPSVRPEPQVLDRVEGVRATYRLQGNELYVRARITSSLAPKYPIHPDDRQKAWVQPVVPVH